MMARKQKQREWIIMVFTHLQRWRWWCWLCSSVENYISKWSSLWPSVEPAQRSKLRPSDMEERGLGGASRLLRVCLHSWIQFGFFQALCCAVTEKHSNNEAGHQLSQNQTCLQARSGQLGWSPELATITGTMVNWTHIWSACVTVWRRLKVSLFCLYLFISCCRRRSVSVMLTRTCQRPQTSELTDVSNKDAAASLAELDLKWAACNFWPGSGGAVTVGNVRLWAVGVHGGQLGYWLFIW